MSKASIKLTKYVSDYNFDPDINRGWGIMVRAEGINIDSEIFVYHRMSDLEVYDGDMFEAVASVNQYYEIPPHQPSGPNNLRSEKESIPYYRRNQLEVFARSSVELDEIWDYIKTDVSRLVADYNSNLKMKSTNTVMISGTMPVDLGSSDSRAVLELEWKPAGNWTGSEITDVDTFAKGWLPVSEVENVLSDVENRVPDQAKWFYNNTADNNFQQLLETVKEPLEVILDQNGIYLTQGEGGAYQLTNDTLYWLENENADLSGTFKNPWPNDYIDGIDVAVEPSIRFSVPS